METIINKNQERTIAALRETFAIFSDWKEESKNIYKRGKPTSILVSWKTDIGIFQYQINSSGCIMKMSRVAGHDGIVLEGFELAVR